MKTTTWTLQQGRDSYQSLHKEATADVVVIGGGLAGVMTAYELVARGKKVVLLEKNTIGSGITSFTTAFLTQSIDTDFSDLIKSFGKDSAQAIIASHGTAIDHIESLVTKHAIDCDFSRCSNYIYGTRTRDIKTLQEETVAAQTLGVKAAFHNNGNTLGFNNSGYIELQNQAKFHPLQFLTAIADYAVPHGLTIYEHSEVASIEKKGKTSIVHTKDGSVTAPWVVVCTYTPFNNPLSLYFRKGTYVSYVVELDVQGMDLAEGTYEDTENPYHYMRVDKEAGGHRVIIGGEDHRKDIPIDATRNYNALIDYSDTIIPKEHRTIRRQWKADILEPIDGIPSIGRIDSTQTLYALGFSGNGMTYSVVSALLFADTITGIKNAWEKLYQPRRTPTLRSLWVKGRDYAGEMIHGALRNTFTESKKKRKK